MGLWSFLTGSQSTPDPKNYPEAVSLAVRHGAERETWFDNLGKTDEETVNGEDYEMLLNRHASELTAATARMTQLEMLRFKTAYNQELAARTEAHTKIVEQQFIDEHPEVHQEQQKAKDLVAAMEQGESVPQWVQAAYQRGVTEGRLRFSVDAGARRQLIETQINALDDWLYELPNDTQSLARWIHGEGEAKGMNEGATEQVASQTVLRQSSFWDQQLYPVKFLAGDFGEGKGYILGSGKVRIPSGSMDFPMRAISSIDIATEENVRRVGGTVGWGIAGAALFGPAGLIAGTIVGGRGKEVTFVAQLSDGKRFLARTSSKAYEKLLAATFA